MRNALKAPDRPISKADESLLSRVNDRTLTIEEARRVVTLQPERAEIDGDYAAHLESTLLGRIGNPVVRASAEAKLSRMKADLAGPNPTALELLVAQRAAIVWHQLNSYELKIEEERNQGPMDARVMIYQERRIESLNRRWLASIKALAFVRKVKLPDLNIKVAVDARTMAGPSEADVIDIATGA